MHEWGISLVPNSKAPKREIWEARRAEKGGRVGGFILYMPGVMTYSCRSSIWEAGAGGQEGQGYLQPIVSLRLLIAT